jgi:hypothetical protein
MGYKSSPAFLKATYASSVAANDYDLLLGQILQIANSLSADTTHQALVASVSVHWPLEKRQCFIRKSYANEHSKEIPFIVFARFGRSDLESIARFRWPIGPT